MLNEKQVNVGILVSWLGAAVGSVLLALNLIYDVPGLGSVGLAAVVITCAHVVQRAVFKRDQMLREAFELGRDHERLQSVRSVR